MATKTAYHDPYETAVAHDDNDGNEIIIERREIVGRIVPNVNGTESMIAAAYLRIGQYMTENAGGVDPIAVEFGYRGATFHASYDPSTIGDTRNA